MQQDSVNQSLGFSTKGLPKPKQSELVILCAVAPH